MILNSWYSCLNSWALKFQVYTTMSNWMQCWGGNSELPPWQASISPTELHLGNVEREQNLGKKGFTTYSSRLCSINVGASQWMRHGASSHIQSQEQRQNVCMPCTQLSLSYLGNGATHSGLGLSRSTEAIRTISHRHAQFQTNVDNSSFRLSFQMILWDGSS